MRIIIGKGYIENNQFYVGDNIVAMQDDDDFSSMLMNVSSRLVEAITIKLDLLGITLENINEKQVRVKQSGLASEDFIEANIEYIAKRTEKSYRRIMGYLMLLCEACKSDSVDVSEAVIIAHLLLNSWNSGLISKKEFLSRKRNVKKFLLERTPESIINGEHPKSTLFIKTQEPTSIIFGVEKTLEEVLDKNEVDIIINNSSVFTSIVNHWIKYNLSDSYLQDKLFSEIGVNVNNFLWEDNQNRKYRINVYKEKQSIQVCLRKVLPIKSLIEFSNESILAGL